MSSWYVDIVETATGTVVKTMGPMSRHKAEKVDDGASRNMDHERFHTVVREAK